MPDSLKITFAPLGSTPTGLAVILAASDLAISKTAAALLAPARDLLARAAAADGFKGGSGSFLDIVAAPASRPTGRNSTSSVSAAPSARACRMP
jgi:leucyl aminopeptidase